MYLRLRCPLLETIYADPSIAQNLKTLITIIIGRTEAINSDLHHAGSAIHLFFFVQSRSPDEGIGTVQRLGALEGCAGDFM